MSGAWRPAREGILSLDSGPPASSTDTCASKEPKRDFERLAAHLPVSSIALRAFLPLRVLVPIQLQVSKVPMPSSCPLPSLPQPPLPSSDNEPELGVGGFHSVAPAPPASNFPPFSYSLKPLLPSYAHKLGMLRKMTKARRPGNFLS